MRAAAGILLLASIGWAQFKSTVPLVVAPTTVTDARGRYIDGLAPEDLTLFDDNVPQTTHMDWITYPVDLVVAVQASSNSRAVIDKLGGSGILFTQLLAGDHGRTAVISFSDEVKVRQDFTGNPDSVNRALRTLRKESARAHTLDAMVKALTLLEQEPLGRRRILLMVAERHDHSSKAKLAEVMDLVQRLSAAVYWLTSSPDSEEDKAQDLPHLFTHWSGGRTLTFWKKETLEQAIQLVGEEVHRQYLLSFEPQASEPGKLHEIRVEVKGRPELQTRTREGYWPLQ